MPTGLRSTLGLVIASILFVAALLEPGMAWFGVPALIGGSLMALFFFVVHRRQMFQEIERATDGAYIGPEQPMFNMSNVKPTGIGGLLMAGLAILAAAQYPQGRLLMTLEVIGGTLVGLALIQLHRPGHLQPARPLRVRS